MGQIPDRVDISSKTPGSDQGEERRVLDVTDNMTVNITEEHPEARRARLTQERREHTFSLFLKSAIFVMLAAALVYAGLKLYNPTSDPEVRKVSVGIITSILSGLLGYFVGKKT